MDCAWPTWDVFSDVESATRWLDQFDVEIK